MQTGLGAAEPKQSAPKLSGVEEALKLKPRVDATPPKAAPAAGVSNENEHDPLDAEAGASKDPIPKRKSGSPTPPPPNEDADEPNAGALNGKALAAGCGAPKLNSTISCCGISPILLSPGPCRGLAPRDF